MNLLIPGSIAHICYTFANGCYQYLNKKNIENFDNCHKKEDLNEGFSNNSNGGILALLIILFILIFVVLLYSLLYVPLKYNRKNNKNNVGIIVILILGFLFFPLINLVTFAALVDKNM